MLAFGKLPNGYPAVPPWKHPEVREALIPALKQAFKGVEVLGLWEGQVLPAARELLPWSFQPMDMAAASTSSNW